ncbi:FtsW/RodA/SpoVE family cell cycle protein [Sporosarcina ureilytica]|uniref:Rod shape-determining protein RodA n=1 Tax=Sporosarcina ureilytica TaxID=298596 RepID=A0A1D8JD85_9BACL|nr:FtsW/RodA/SpoVE family cell cycle protein [Sporosarcina ureilytica]AOV06663.1 rod shape-determining protein RodA [Sporosarcina ureilytica]
MKLSNKPIERFDWTLAFILLLFCIVSLFAIGSANANYVPRQLIWYGISIFIIAGAMYFEPEQYKKVAWYLYGFGVFLLVFLYFAPSGVGQIGQTHANVKRWLHFPEPIGRIQPAEFIKTFFILGMARLVSKHHEKFENKTIKTDFILLGKMFLVLVVPLGFIAQQPDLGTSIVLIAITAAMVLVAGISWKIILPVFVTGVTTGTALLWAAIYAQDFMIELGFDPYQFERIYSWLDPYSYPSGEGMHLISSLTAIGSGGMSGKGFGGREVYVPENHTDFIFSVIGEEYGFIGACVVIGLFFFLIYHMTKIALELKDPFSTYVCTGIIAMITFHVFENIGMTIQVMPITGIPLPFISYGGSSLMSNMLAIGLIFSMKFHHRTYMFEADEDE